MTAWQFRQHGERLSSGEGISLVITPHTKNLGSFSVKRALPDQKLQMVGPFIFFDQFGPAVLPHDKAVDVRPHPHIGISTITWLFDGEIRHKDSLGSDQVIRAGEVNWMTAGSGIVHSERSPDALKDQEKSLYGIQAWVALPSDSEDCDPGFYHYKADQIPQYDEAGIRISLITGSGWGQASPVITVSETLYAEIRLDAGTSLNLPDEVPERAVYVCEGSAQINGKRVESGTMAVLKQGVQVDVHAEIPLRLVLIGGQPVDGERFIEWNFVASSRDRIEQAKQRWRDNDFPRVPGDDEFIPLPE